MINMKILLYDIGSFTQKDLIYFLEKSGFHCRNVMYKPQNFYQDEFFERKFKEQLVKDDYDFVMSTNFYPIVAKICYEAHMKYLAWVYDSPIDATQIAYYQYPTSYVFLFDRLEAERIRRLGGENIFHLPLAINSDRLNRIAISASDRETFSADISFVGQFYGSPLKTLMAVQEDYDRGYLDGLLATQLRVYGYNFIEEMISEEFTQRIHKRLMERHILLTAYSRDGVIHNVAKTITNTERLVLLSALGKAHGVRYYSGEQPSTLSHLSYGGTAYYFRTMPKIFRLSRLNLNITLKCIQSGIPLRALDILGCKGALFSNYQPELAEYFTDGEDVILYDSIPDALEKAAYYLKHTDLLQQIAQKGYEKACTQFSYPDKIAAMLKTAGLL